jgi:hypothetical protein
MIVSSEESDDSVALKEDRNLIPQERRLKVTWPNNCLTECDGAPGVSALFMIIFFLDKAYIWYTIWFVDKSYF